MRQRVTCDECDKSFMSQPSLNRHKKYIHVGMEERQTCVHCSKILKNKPSLRYHIKYSCPKVSFYTPPLSF